MGVSLGFAVLAVVAGTAIGSAAWILHRLRRNPAEHECKRRALISAQGRLIEGVVTDYADGIVYYTYSWRGVEYAAAQDLNWCSGEGPDSPAPLIGAVTVKFLAADSASSIVFAESWSGFPRFRQLAARTSH